MTRSSDADVDSVRYCAFTNADSTIVVDLKHFIGAVILCINLCLDVLYIE